MPYPMSINTYSTSLSSKNKIFILVTCLLVKCILNSNFVACILFTDEIVFMQKGVTNFHNNNTYGQ